MLASGESVLLQTAQVIVCGTDGAKSQAHVLMDSASHRTFMTEQMAKKLKLQPQRREALSVATFGTKKPQNLETFVVEFSLTTKEGLTIGLHANVLPQITGPILRGPLHQEDIKFLKAITPDKMADNIPIQLSSATIDYSAWIGLLLEYSGWRQNCSPFWVIVDIF